MPTLAQTVEAFLAAREYDNATAGRLAFWVDEVGDKELAQITTDEVDAALIRLFETSLMGSNVEYSNRYAPPFSAHLRRLARF